MPCDTVQINRIQWQKVSQSWLQKAVAELGWRMNVYSTNVSVYTPNGQIDIDMRTGLVVSTMSESILNQQLNKMKVGYSNHLVKAQAKKMGWNVKQTGPNKYQVIRR